MELFYTLIPAIVLVAVALPAVKYVFHERIEWGNTFTIKVREDSWNWDVGFQTLHCQGPVINLKLTLSGFLYSLFVMGKKHPVLIARAVILLGGVRGWVFGAGLIGWVYTYIFVVIPDTPPTVDSFIVGNIPDAIIAPKEAPQIPLHVGDSMPTSSTSPITFLTLPPKSSGEFLVRTDRKGNILIPNTQEGVILSTERTSSNNNQDVLPLLTNNQTSPLSSSPRHNVCVITGLSSDLTFTGRQEVNILGLLEKAVGKLMAMEDKGIHEGKEYENLAGVIYTAEKSLITLKNSNPLSSTGNVIGEESASGIIDNTALNTTRRRVEDAFEPLLSTSQGLDFSHYSLEQKRIFSNIEEKLISLQKRKAEMRGEDYWKEIFINNRLILDFEATFGVWGSSGTTVMCGGREIISPGVFHIYLTI